MKGNEQDTLEVNLMVRGLMLVLSSPSGAGKTTLSRWLRKLDKQIEVSVSVTTRPQRLGEKDGEDYHFTDPDGFKRMQEEGLLLEWASVFGHLYGTPRVSVDKALRQGRDILFDIDWQGMRQLQEKMPEDLVRVFILPPSSKLLWERLRGRAQDSEEVVEQRMAAACREISHWSEYDYVIINDDIKKSVKALASILAAERLKRTRNIGLPEFVAKVQNGLS